MLILTLIWLLLGAAIGLLANVAQLRPRNWQHLGWLAMVGLGMVTALCGGWLGVLLFGRLFSTATALWIGCLGVMLPSLLNRMAMWRSTTSISIPIHFPEPLIRRSPGTVLPHADKQK
ncbi:MAG TPA: hypothetical protein VKR06_17430 [Ktedonosporobacter sp.]|nr:hypothetical protein [Ktedonosporobacter sp.]